MPSPETPYTIGRLGELCGLSRSTLLYYDSIGLLRPSGRSGSGYRLYSEADKSRLERVLSFRALGLSLERISAFLDLPDESPAGALLRRVFEINGQIAELKAQQRGIIDLLEEDGSLKKGAGLLAMKALGAEAGIHEGNYKAVHAAFESASPSEHRRLLALLGLAPAEIEEFLASVEENR